MITLSLSKLLLPEYYLNPNPGGDFLLGYGLLVFFIFIFFLGSIAKNISTHNKHLKKSMRHQFWKFYFLGATGIVLVLSRFAGVPGFSMRLRLYITLVLTLIILGITFFRIWKGYRRRLESVERERRKKI